MKIDFCGGCGRIVLVGFTYCPYCGIALKAGPGLEEAMSGPFERLDALQRVGQRERRIDELLDELDALESDMEGIIHGTAARG